MMIALLLNGEIQAILPKSYIDMLVEAGSYDFRIIDYYEGDIEYTLLAGSRNITFDEWCIVENDGTKRPTLIDLYSKSYERCKCNI